jgi:hypothetical protein
MTKFIKENFDIYSSGGECWAHYKLDGDYTKRTFVARFKYGSPAAVVRGHVKHLIQHVSVEEWQQLNAMPHSDPTGAKTWIELRQEQDAFRKTLFEDRGYIQFNVRKLMNTYGFVTPAALTQWSMACSDARRNNQPVPLSPSQEAERAKWANMRLIEV